MGVQYLIGLFLDFQYIRQYGPLLISLNALVGLIILVPISILLGVTINIVLKDNKVEHLISEVIQFILFFMYMRWSVEHFNIAKFNSLSSELIFYIITYLFFFGIERIGNIVKKEDEKSFNSN
ncbi:hypothetical protein [Priestia filamentosa]|uniref:hypothetical protein n=1 Tax=Priestia filamentosa TaxID=1402861 RepID=UPI003979C6D8